MGKLSPKAFAHYRELLYFIEDTKSPRVISDYVADILKDLDHEAGAELDKFNTNFFDEMDSINKKFGVAE